MLEFMFMVSVVCIGVMVLASFVIRRIWVRAMMLTAHPVVLAARERVLETGVPETVWVNGRQITVKIDSKAAR